MPPAFRFQSLLNYRQRCVEDKQTALARAQQHLRACQTGLAQLRKEHARLVSQLEAALHGYLTAEEVQRRYRFLAVTEKRISEQEERIVAAQQTVVSARQELAEALKERKTLDKLREYDQQAFLSEVQRKEMAALDDLNIGRFVRATR